MPKMKTSKSAAKRFKVSETVKECEFVRRKRKWQELKAV